jgi:hypothetical protein
VTLPAEKRELAVELYVAGLTLRETGAAVGVAPTTVLYWLKQARVPRRPAIRRADREPTLAPGGDTVHLAPFREVFRRSGLTVAEVARAADMDEAQAARLLGTRAACSSHVLAGGRRRRYRVIQRTARYATAVRLCRALHADPWEVGI